MDYKATEQDIKDLNEGEKSKMIVSDDPSRISIPKTDNKSGEDKDFEELANPKDSSDSKGLRRDNESIDDFEHLEHDNLAGKSDDALVDSKQQLHVGDNDNNISRQDEKENQDTDAAGDRTQDLYTNTFQAENGSERLSSSKLFDSYENTEALGKKSAPSVAEGLHDQRGELESDDFDPFSKNSVSHDDKKSSSLAFMEAERDNASWRNTGVTNDNFKTDFLGLDSDSDVKLPENVSSFTDKTDTVPLPIETEKSMPEPKETVKPEPESKDSAKPEPETSDDVIVEKLKLAGLDVDPEFIQQDIKPIPSAPEPDPELTPAVPLSSYPSTPLEPVPESTVFPPAGKTTQPKAIDEVLPTPATSQTSDKNEKLVSMVDYIRIGTWFHPDRLHPKVVELVYWRDPKKSGIVFGSILGILLSLSYFSLISVVAYLSLALLTGTICFRVYKNVLQAVQKTSDGHPFKDFLEMDLNLPQDKVREVTDVVVSHVNAALVELRRLFLVEDLVDSIKFGVLLWCLTYLGAWFNGMTLVIIAFVALFTLPKVYETNKTQIDQNLELVRSKISDISAKVKAAVPIGKKVEEKKDQ